MSSCFKQLPRVAVTLAAASALFGVAAPAAHAGVIYNNLGSHTDGSDPVFGTGPLADSFTTGAGGTSFLASVQALLTNGGTDIVGDLQVGLYADGGNAPGAELVSLGQLSSASVTNAGFAAYTFTPAAAYQLAANTTYWVEIAFTGADAVEWGWSDDLSGPGVAGQSNNSHAFGTSSNSSFAPYQMMVTTAAAPTAIPEPGSLALVALGMGLVVSVRRSRKG